MRNGFRLSGTRIENGAERVRLFTATGGWVDIAKQQVLHIESELEAPSTASEASKTDSPAGPATRVAETIARMAVDEGIPSTLLRAVAQAESGLRQGAISDAGAVGIMQLLPSTAAELGVDPHVAADNVRGGARYLRQMLERFEGDKNQLVKALAAYNAGPGRVAEYGGVPPYEETTAYVDRVVRSYLQLDREVQRADRSVGTLGGCSPKDSERLPDSCRIETSRERPGKEDIPEHLIGSYR